MKQGVGSIPVMYRVSSVAGDQFGKTPTLLTP